MPAAPSCCCKSGLYPLPGQGALVLGKRPEDVEQKLSMRRVRVHTLRQRPERDTAVAQASHDVEQVGQRAAKAIELPHHQRVTGFQEGETRRDAGAVVTRARRLVLEQVAGIDAGGPGLRSISRRVPPGVPSVDHNSRPWTASSALK